MNKSNIYNSYNLHLSGSEYKYQPENWKKNEIKQNCYGYALNKYNDDTINYPQMGEFGIPDFKKYYNEDRDFGCSPYEYRILKDNPHIYKVPENKSCKKGYYKTYFVVAPNKDFHWYRQDKDGYYSHKPGQLKVRDYDMSKSKNKIKNPIFSNRTDYTYKNDVLDYSVVCNTFCIPKDNVYIE